MEPCGTVQMANQFDKRNQKLVYIYIFIVYIYSDISFPSTDAGLLPTETIYLALSTFVLFGFDFDV